MKHVLRRLTRSPLFTLVTLVTIGVGIGANTAIFSVINGILLKPLPYPEPERLVSVWQKAPGIGIANLNASPSDFFTFREENRTFQRFGIWGGGSVSITGLDAPEQVPILQVTEDTLQALGVQPVLGRWFNSMDVAPGSPGTAILTHGYWQRRFGGEASAVGRRILADGEAKQIIGVMPKSFRFLDEKPDLILPFQFDRNKVFLGNFSYQAIARLKPGVTPAMANADLARMIPMVNTKFPPPPGFSAKLFEDARIQPDIRPLKQDVVGDLGKVLWVLMGSIGVVLLIACANVANLLLVRAEARQHELAIRAALGAGTAQLASEIMIESILLGVAGGIAGLALAYGALRLLVRLAPAHLPRLENITIDPVVLLFTLALSLLAGVLFGVIPVAKYAVPKVNAALRAGGRTLGQSRESHRAQNALVILQVALAMVLLVGSGLMIRTFLALRRVEPGFTGARELQMVRIFIPEAQVKEPVRVVRMLQEVQRKIAEIPGITSVAFANSVPTDGNNSADLLYAEDHAYQEGKLPPIRRFKFVAPGFFHTMGIKLVAGRDFSWNDLYDRRTAVIISENMARELWHDPGSAIGKRVREGMKDPWREIIGVVGDVRQDGADQKAPTTVYWPMMMNNFWGEETFLQRRAVYAIRSSRAGSESLLNQVRQAIWSVNSEVPLASIRTMEDLYRGSMARSSFTLVMLALAGGMALLLGIVGIYGVISYSVSQRTREIGIRIALGAERSTLEAMVVRHGVILAGIGIAIGLAGAAAVTRIMTSFLFEISPVDPLTYAGVSAGLLGCAAAASFLPAHRASAVNPVDALRSE
ncbi:MAG TPA: ABC transporter permease [Bryobacteraceae bacterium]|nr:ABC transporter permease [Bryobacteraceae bacterium]